MLNLVKTLEHMNIPLNSVSKAIQVVRHKLTIAKSDITGSERFIKSLLDLDIKFDNEDKARLTAFSVTEQIIQLQGQVPDPEEVLKKALARADGFVKDPSFAWMFVKGASNVAGNGEHVEEAAVVDGVSTKVAVKADGSIKRGGKEILAAELYKKHVIEAEQPLARSDFVKVLMKELGMTIAGARTYAYNMAKKFEQEKATA